MSQAVTFAVSLCLGIGAIGGIVLWELVWWIINHIRVVLV